ncbi:putative protoporphyrin ferrochelatase [Rosa chinensis]|uniref:Ferrochelatase n=1 Tax=Rosa chinensis TaxID=74649 RepID=A0A2P6PR91_ROSCH|nr:ferrochelatase-1, chloroplastic/mitochondrial [Rosa chinensis]PRQ24450.1 putative protoporphyrin ferrochelatase [Rosa chinensis]
MDAAVSCPGVLPQMKLSSSGLSLSDHKFQIGRSYARSIGALSCNKGLRIVPKKLKFLCSAASRDDERNEMVFGASHWEKKSPVGETLCVAAGVCTYGGTAVESHHSHTVEEKVGVLLLNLGGPETLDDVQPFLFNLFADPDIIRLPRVFRFLQKPLAKLISVLRAPKSKEGYASIGGGSPLRKMTDEQANALKMALESKDMPVNVYVGMRYWFPFTEEAVHQIKRDRITRLVVLPLYPQFSISTTGSSVRVLQKIFRNDPYLSRLPVSVINSWYQREGYIKSMADLISKELESFSEPAQVMIFFSAHGVPLSYVKDSGDPYKDQMEECIFLIMKELKARGINNEHTLAYQSRVGPVQWLKPYTDEVLVELGRKGVKSLLTVPVSFVSEHIETLEEIDMEYKELALESGIENWGRVPALGLTPSFITDLADAVIEALPLAAATSTPKITSAVDHDPMRWAIKMFFGSFLAFFLFFSPKMLMAFRNHLI